MQWVTGLADHPGYHARVLRPARHGRDRGQPDRAVVRRGDRHPGCGQRHQRIRAANGAGTPGTRAGAGRRHADCSSRRTKRAHRRLRLRSTGRCPTPSAGPCSSRCPARFRSSISSAQPGCRICVVTTLARRVLDLVLDAAGLRRSIDFDAGRRGRTPRVPGTRPSPDGDDAGRHRSCAQCRARPRNRRWASKAAVALGQASWPGS